jgi:hypothetical protein
LLLCLRVAIVLLPSTITGVDVNAGLLFTQCGTPDYCAPEIIECVEEGYNGAKVDVWSCGIILYALLVGGLPFREEETDKLYDLILSCNVYYPPFLSAPAKDLLSRLLVRDPAHRANMADIKRHTWFLVDYKGDDARSLRKPAFYNKSGAVATRRSPTPSGQPAHQPPEQEAAAAASSASPAEPATGPSVDDATPAPAVPPEPAASPVDPRPAAGTVAALVRAHERNASPVDPTASPPPPDVFTPVLDRPATPAQRGKIAVRLPQEAKTAGQASPAALAATASSRAVSESANLGAERAAARAKRQSRTGGDSGDAPGARDAAARYADDEEGETSFVADAAETPKEQNLSAVTEDASSEDGSVEDYRSRPVPALLLPQNERFVRHQTAQQIGQQQPLSAPSVALRHRSDTHVRVAGQPAGYIQPSTLAPPPQPVAVVVQRGYRGGSPSAVAVASSIGARASSPFRRPLVANGVAPAQAESRGSLLAGRPVRYSESPRASNSPVMSGSSMDKQSGPSRGLYQGGVATGNTVPWHDNGPVQPDEAGGDPRAYPQSRGGSDGQWFESEAEALAHRLWGLFDRWRNVSEEAVSPHVHASPELRMDFRAIQAALVGVTDLDEKLAVYEQFMVFFGKHGLGDVTGGRLDDGGYESSSSLRRLPTDMSSEDDMGWSPTIYEPYRNKSDLARRRDVSDLLTKWMRKYSTGSNGAGGAVGSHVSRENSMDGPFGGSEDGYAPAEMVELQRLVKQHQREDSGLAEELERLMKAAEPAESAGDSPSYSSLTGSPAPPEARWFGSAGDGTNSGHRVARAGSHADYASEASNGPISASAPRLGEALVPPPSTASVPAPAYQASRRGNRKPDTAASMGLDDVEYYGSDRRVARVKAVLTQMKVRNQRIVETATCFQSSQDPSTILLILSNILHNMGGLVQMKRETKRKLKCVLHLESGTLHAGIELTVAENGFTIVSFKRSRHDRGRTDTMAFNNFYTTVRQQFIAEVQAQGPRTQRRIPASSQSSRRKGLKSQEAQPASMQFDDAPISQSSLAGDLETHSSYGPGSGLLPSSWSRTAAVGRGIDSRLAPRAASDMR